LKKEITVITIWSVLAIGLHLSASFALAGEQLWTFDNNADGWTVANGTWTAQNGVYSVAAGEAAMHSIVGDVNWTDYVLEAKVRLDAGNWAGLVFRAQNEFEYYVYYLNVPDNKSELWRHRQGAFDARNAITSNIPATNITIVNGEWLDVQVVVEGDTFRFWINGELQGELQDTVGPSYASGMIGVWAWDTAASFDDVRVSGDDIPGTVTPVEPKDKLTTAWGRIKQR
jgi:hypothetical protein